MQWMHQQNITYIFEFLIVNYIFTYYIDVYRIFINFNIHTSMYVNTFAVCCFYLYYKNNTY